MKKATKKTAKKTAKKATKTAKPKPLRLSGLPLPKAQIEALKSIAKAAGASEEMQRVDLTGDHGEVDGVAGLQCAEGFRETLETEQRFSHAAPSPPAGR